MEQVATDDGVVFGISHYDLVKPNKVLEVFMCPLRLRRLHAISDNGRLLDGYATHQQPMVIDLEKRRAYALAEVRSIEHLLGAKSREFKLHTIDDRHRACAGQPCVDSSLHFASHPWRGDLGQLPFWLQ